MPTPRMLIDLSLDQLDKALIGRLSLSICLSIVWRRPDQLDARVTSKFSELLSYEDRPSICCDGLRNPEPVNDMFFNKIDDVLRRH
jgi:hypothetical protein